LPLRLQDGALPRAAPRAACPRPFSRFFALAVWAGGLLTTVIRPQPCGLVSLRMGITQYSEVSAEYASLLVENYTNALRSVRKYDLEFFQPLAAPRTTTNPPNNPNASKSGARGTQKTTRIRTHQQRAPRATMGPSYGHRAVSRAETRKQPKCTRRGYGVASGTQEATGILKRQQRGKKEVIQPSYGGTRDDEA